MLVWNKSAEDENQNLREEIKKEKMKYFELEKQWENSRCCACSKEDYAEAASIKVVTSFELRSGLDEHKSNDGHEVCLQNFVSLLLLLVYYDDMVTYL